MRIATFNAKNMFGPGEWMHYGQMIKFNDKFVAKRIKYFVKTISRLRPDIMLMQEIGSTEVLSEIASKLPGKFHSFVAQPDWRGIANAILYKENYQGLFQSIQLVPSLPPILGRNIGSILKYPRRRAIVYGQFTYNNLPLHIVGLHLKSASPSFLAATSKKVKPTSQLEFSDALIRAALVRLAEARAVRQIVDDILRHHPNAQLIVAGDFNDSELSPTVRAIEGENARLGNILQNICLRIPSARRYSKITNGVKRLLDHMLVSEKLIKKGPRAAVFNKKLKDQDNLDLLAEVFFIESDHAPVVMDLKG